MSLTYNITKQKLFIRAKLMFTIFMWLSNLNPCFLGDSVACEGFCLFQQKMHIYLIIITRDFILFDEYN